MWLSYYYFSISSLLPFSTLQPSSSWYSNFCSSTAGGNHVLPISNSPVQNISKKETWTHGTVGANSVVINRKDLVRFILCFHSHWVTKANTELPSLTCRGSVNNSLGSDVFNVRVSQHQPTCPIVKCNKNKCLFPFNCWCSIFFFFF